ncbi:MAG: HdeD family acid-resistance protein [Hyphomicrobiaceae bacterium]
MAISTHPVDIGTATEPVRSNRGWFLALGIVLILCGSLAILLPVLSTLAATFAIAIALAISGISQIIHAFRTRGWRGFFWNLATGVIELLGGLVIWFNPFAGAVVITAIIGAVFLLQGISQISMALSVRPNDGWGWMLTAGIVTVLASIWLFFRIPVIGLFAPGMIVGIALLFEGWAFVAISMTGKQREAMA